MNYTQEAWEEEQMSNLGCESVSDLIAEVKRLRGVIAKVWDLVQNSNHEEREMFFWGFDKKNTGWIKRYEELAMKELNWDWWGEEE